jgi:signal transduction histidine kinase
MRPRIFDLFIGSGASGLGLGLWLSRYIVERHGGSIELQEFGSGEPKVDCPVGASFLVRLAVAQASTPS